MTCSFDCKCRKHQSQKGRFQPKCQPGCACKKHYRTVEHNRRIGLSVALTAEAKRYDRATG